MLGKGLSLSLLSCLLVLSSQANTQVSVKGNGFTSPGSSTFITSGAQGTTIVYTNGKNGEKVTTFAPKQFSYPLNFIRSNNAYYKTNYSYLDHIDYGLYTRYNLANQLALNYNSQQVTYKPYVYMGTFVATGRSNIYGHENYSASVLGTGITLPFVGGSKISLEASVVSPNYQDSFWRRRW
ncbi:hypothetical protein CJP74_01345 [Psittacicella melopsittaci]|uniref:IPT/TIG domain-containing protein n=1 Tax=Psittacicella melopsittaci TaxID=2028576 RepID=A0A3A1Y8W6_9GAMM|nr:hypothetical protein [Psittacicella melopsittaci]RIY33660.1 hypothetical protein CJP74_01345 [Psittacicella melopsittaci]